MAIHGLVTAGWLAVFAAGPDGFLGHMRQTSLDNQWSEWEDVGPQISGEPAVFHNHDDGLEVFAKTADGRLGHMWQTEAEGEWSPWEEIGAAILGDPVVFHNDDGHLELFARGPKGLLGHMWQKQPDYSWSEWEDIGPAISDNPAVFQNADGHLELFAAGPGGVLGHLWQNVPNGLTGWSEWEELGPEISGSPALFLNTDGNLEVFARGPTGALGHRWQTQPDFGWSEWEEIGPELSSDPAVFRNADSRLEVFAVGPGGVLGHIWQELPHHSWSDWEELGPVISSDPVVFQNADGRLELFAAGPDGLLGHSSQRDTRGAEGWSDWEDLGPAISSQRPAVGQVGLIGGLGLREDSAPRVRSEMAADVCVIGAGPAGVAVADGLVRAGASVVLVESGTLEGDLVTQDLNDGLADGPIIKQQLNYLREGRRRAVQGSASIWGPGFCMPFRPIDLEQRPWVTDSGWPLAPEDLAPYETRAAETFAFDAFAPPVADGQLVRLRYHFPPEPQVFRAKYLDLLTNPLFQSALSTTAVGLGMRGDRVDSVRLARANGDEMRVTADTVVLAAGGVENARFLMLHEKNLGPSAVTGRWFMEHPHVLAGTIQMPNEARLLPSLDKGATLDVFALDEVTQSDKRLLNVSVQLRPRGDSPPGSGMTECDLYVRAEQAPNPESRVVLGDRLDPLGFPQPVLHWRLLEQDWDSIIRTTDLVAAALEEGYGARAHRLLSQDDPWPDKPAGPDRALNSTWGNHHMGTTRMGDQPADSVVDHDCRLHGTANLYLAGSSVFPTGGCANPTFMIVTLAHRLVDHLSGTR